MKFGEFTFIEDEGEVFVRTTYFTSLEGIFDFFETIDGPLDLIDVGITEARRIDLIPDEQALCDDLSKIYIEWISIPNSAVRSIRTPIGRLESILNQCKEFKESELPPLTIQYSLNWDGKPGEVITENYYLVARHPKYGTILEDDECFLVIQDYVIDKIQSTIENLVDTWNKFEQGQIAANQAAPEPEITQKDLPKWSLAQRYLALELMGAKDYLVELQISRTSIHKLIAVTLNCSIENAKKLLSGKYRPYKNMRGEDITDVEITLTDWGYKGLKRGT